MNVKFDKMQALGNDYVLLDFREEKVDKKSQISAPYDAFFDTAALAVRLCDRRTGVGADGVLIVENSSVADAKMRIFNADGSEAELCGNGLRCVVKKIADDPDVKKSVFSIRTACGVKPARVTRIGGAVKTVCIETGRAIFASPSAFASSSEPAASASPDRTARKETEISATFGEKRLTLTCLSVGNPHCVVFCKDTLDAFDEYAAALSSFPYFPHGTNVEFVRVDGANHLTMRVFERGCGETFSCGTGACAAVAAAIRTGKAEEDSWIEVKTKGGSLRVKQRRDILYLSGDVSYVFTGEISL